MADNVTLPGTGSVVATDDVGGVQYQQVKLVDGTLDSSTPVGTNANPLKVTSSPSQNPNGLPVDSDALNTLIAGTSTSQDQRSLLDVLDPLSDNYVPPQAEVIGERGRVLAQDPDGALVAAAKNVTYQGQIYTDTVNTLVVFSCSGYMTAMVNLLVTGAGSVQVETFIPGSGWNAPAGAAVIANNSGLIGYGYQAVAASNVPYQIPLYGATHIRFRVTGSGAGGTCRYSLQLSPFPLGVMTVAAVSNGAASNLLCTNTPTTPTAATNLNSAATTNATSVKASAGRIFALSATNNGAAVCFLKLYNKASAPTVGTDTPVQVLSIPANGVPLNLDFGPLGLQFSTGIAYALTNLIGDADTTAVAASQVKLMMSYV